MRSGGFVLFPIIRKNEDSGLRSAWSSRRLQWRKDLLDGLCHGNDTLSPGLQVNCLWSIPQCQLDIELRIV